MLTLNAQKCISKVFTLRRPLDPPELILIGNKLKWNPANEAVRYLGVHLDRRLTWNHHINIKLTQTYSRLGMLYPIINRKSSLKPETAILIYKTILRPLLMYMRSVGGSFLYKTEKITNFSK